VSVELGGRVLLAVIDGLGHGAAAAAAAVSAATVAEAHAGEPPDHVLARCHEALNGTRGAVITLASVDLPAATLTWCGVGDVAGIVVRNARGVETRYVFAPVRAGIVGLHMSLVRPVVLPLEPGDVLILASDGVRLPLDLSCARSESAQGLADRILAEHALESDDATILVARYAEASA
jgi:phosphoserine phosphatase RsbX